MIDSLKQWREFCNNEHDVVCNQKYANKLPYSFHLGCVFTQARTWLHLLPSDSDRLVALFGACGHDLIEDARMTHNDILEKVERLILVDDSFRIKMNSLDSVSIITTDIAETIYNVTDDKGRNRKERKNDSYYAELKANPIAVYVKLCDLASNTMFSKATGHSMYKKYKKEFPNLKEKLYLPQFEELFNFIETL